MNVPFMFSNNNSPYERLFRSRAEYHEIAFNISLLQRNYESSFQSWLAFSRLLHPFTSVSPSVDLATFVEKPGTTDKKALQDATWLLKTS